MKKLFVCGDIQYKAGILKGKSVILPKIFQSDALEKKEKIKIISELKENNAKLRLLSENQKSLLNEITKKLSTNEFEQIDTTVHEKTFKKLGEIIEKMEEISETNSMLEKELEQLDANFEIIPRKLNLTKKIHGFSGIILNNNKAIITFHTSQIDSNILGIYDNNIELKEENNPIKSVNKPQIIALDDLKTYFKISEPQKMINSPRYENCGKHEDFDMIYCAYRAMCHSIAKSNTALHVKFGKNINSIEIIQDCHFQIDQNSIAHSPVEIVIENQNISIDLAEDMKDLLKNEISQEKKKELLEEARENYITYFKQDVA